VSTLTAPYRPDAGQTVAQAHTQVFEAVAVVPGADPVPLDVTDYLLTWDERSAPRVEAELTCRVPDADVLAQLDPRTGVRVEITAGYVLPGGARDVALVADLGLRRRQVSRPADTMSLNAMSDEALVIDASPVTLGSASGNTIPLAMQALIFQALTPDPTVTITHPDTTATTVAEIADRWATIADLADSIGAQVFDDGLRHWHIDPVPAVASVAAAILKVGTNGTILSSSSTLDRDDWANTVRLRYRWTNALGVDQLVTGSAVVASGPYAPATAGTRVYAEDRETPTTTNQANAAAAALLPRFLSRSRSYTLTAVAAWWLRPGRTVTVQLPTGGQERHLVSRVAFSTGGRMAVTTRLPDNVSPIGE
jgi:hypothetical protein